MKCLNQECVNKVTSVAGRRPRLYCSNNCRQKDWQRKQKEKLADFCGRGGQSLPVDYVEVKEVGVIGADGVVRPLFKPDKPPKPKKQEIVPPKDETPANPPQNGSQQHPLWKVGDPKENSGAFYLKYDCNNYDELSKLKK